MCCCLYHDFCNTCDNSLCFLVYTRSDSTHYKIAKNIFFVYNIRGY